MFEMKLNTGPDSWQVRHSENRNRNYPNAERRKNLKNEKVVTELWDNIRKPDIHVFKVPQGEVGEQKENT